jgi:Family of unknown function (DUF6527)
MGYAMRHAGLSSMRSEMRNGSIVLGQPMAVRLTDGKRRIFNGGSGTYSFTCPGCGGVHTYRTPVWDWNGSVSWPTFYPSYRMRLDGGTCCHFFVTDGRIAFEPDSTHSLAGQTVDLPEIPE